MHACMHHIAIYSKLYAWMQITCNHMLLSTYSLNIFIPYGVTDICSMHGHMYLTERMRVFKNRRLKALIEKRVTSNLSVCTFLVVKLNWL